MRLCVGVAGEMLLEWFVRMGPVDIKSSVL